MSDLGAQPTESGLSVADEATWLRLRNVVARERGFWFGALFVTDERRLAELQRRTSSFVTGSGREQRVGVAARPGDLRDVVAELLSAEPGAAGLWWIVATGSLATGHGEPSDWYSAWVSAVTALNRRRDAMRATLHGGLMLVGPPGLLRILATRAVDLWSVRTFTAELARAAPAARPIAGRPELVGERSGDPDLPDTSLDALTLSDVVTARVRSIDALLARGETGAALADAAALVDDAGDDHERLAGLELVARARAAQRYYETAADAARDVVELRSAVFGPDHPDTPIRPRRRRHHPVPKPAHRPHPHPGPRPPRHPHHPSGARALGGEGGAVNPPQTTGSSSGNQERRTRPPTGVVGSSSRTECAWSPRFLSMLFSRPRRWR